MAKYQDEYVVGHVATEDTYDENWDTPTWFDLWNSLEENNINEFAITPLGRIGSDKRKFGSTQVVVTKEDVLNVLRDLAKEQIQQENFIGDPNNADDVRDVSAIIWIDPAWSPVLTERLCFLMQDIVHLTGWAIKAIR